MKSIWEKASRLSLSDSGSASVRIERSTKPQRSNSSTRQFAPEIEHIIEELEFIAQHLREKQENERVRI